MWLFQRFQDWQDYVGKSDEEVAALIKVSRSTISRCKRGLQRMRTEHALEIEKISGIPPAEWAAFHAEVVEAKRAAPAGKAQKKSRRAEPEAA